jgi:hypothetical protein
MKNIMDAKSETSHSGELFVIHSFVSGFSFVARWLVAHQKLEIRN